LIASGGGGTGSQDGVLYCVSSNHGFVGFELAGEAYTLTGVTHPTTALGYGRDGWWYGNGGAQDPHTLYRLQPELVFNPVTQRDEPVVEPVGAGLRSIEDVAASPDGSVLYGVGDGFLFTLNRQDGKQTDIGPLGFLGAGLAFMDSGELVANDGDQLYIVDPATAQTTLLGPMYNSPNDLAGASLTATAAPSLQGGRALAALPNPFQPGAKIRFQIDQPQDARIVVYDVAGRFVREIATGTWSVGDHVASWDGRDTTGQTVASGTYFLRFTGSTGEEDSRKISLVR